MSHGTDRRTTNDSAPVELSPYQRLASRPDEDTLGQVSVGHERTVYLLARDGWCYGQQTGGDHEAEHTPLFGTPTEALASMVFDGMAEGSRCTIYRATLRVEAVEATEAEAAAFAEAWGAEAKIPRNYLRRSLNTILDSARHADAIEAFVAKFEAEPKMTPEIFDALRAFLDERDPRLGMSRAAKRGGA